MFPLVTALDGLTSSDTVATPLCKDGDEGKVIQPAPYGEPAAWHDDDDSDSGRWGDGL